MNFTSPRLTRALALVTVALAPLAVAAQSDPTHALGKTTLPAIIGRFIATALGFLGVIALVVFLWSGFTWMTAMGNADKVKHAQRMIIYAITGLVVCFGSYAMLTFVLNALGG